MAQRMVSKTKLVFTVSMELEGGKVNTKTIADQIRSLVRDAVVPAPKKPSVTVKLIERNVNRKMEDVT